MVVLEGQGKEHKKENSLSFARTSMVVLQGQGKGVQEGEQFQFCI